MNDPMISRITRNLAPNEANLSVCETMLDLCPIDIFVVAEDGSVLYVNRTACSRRAISRNKMLTKKVWEWNQFVTQSSWSRRWQALKQSRSANFDTVHVDKRGREIPVRIDVQMVEFNGQGGALCYVQDISSIKRNEEDASRFGKELGLIFSGSGMSMCRWDPSTDEVKIDPAWVSMFGTWAEHQTITFSQWEQMVAEKDRVEWQTRLTSHLLGHDDSFDMVLRMYHVNGRPLEIHARGKVVELDHEGHPSAISILHEDISERVRLEREARDHLRQIEQNTIDLEEAKNIAEASVERLETMSRKRDLLYATVAHELRTPISSLSLMANEDSEVEWSARQAQIGRICRDLIHTLDDMRRLVRPEEQREIRSEYFTVSELVEAVSISVSAYTATTGVNYVIDDQRSPVDADRLYISDLYRIKIVLSNLIKNACLHSQGAEVRFSIVQLSRSENADVLEFSVKDDGVGIPQSEIEELFQPFKRGATQSDGTGLGLHIAHSWIAGLGGVLAYKRQPKGAQFTVELALKHARLDERSCDTPGWGEQRPADHKQLSDLVVLMVEDEPMLRMVGQKVLEKVFNRVDLAANGREALEHVASEDYDLILTDYFMPELNGLELVNSLKQRGFNGLIVGITAATLGSEIEDLLAAGAHKVFAKPLNKDALQEWVSNNVDFVDNSMSDIGMQDRSNGAAGTLRIDLKSGAITADEQWRALNDIAPGQVVDSTILGQTIHVDDRERFREYSVNLIKSPKFGQTESIELKLVSLSDRTFMGLVSSQKLSDETGDYILSTVELI